MIKNLCIITLLCICFFLFNDRCSFSENSETEDFIVIKKSFEDGFYKISANQLNDFIKKYPKSDKIPEAHLLLGISFYHLEKYDRAAFELEYLINSASGSFYEDEILYWFGEIYLKRLDFQASLESFQTLIDKFPNSKFLKHAYYSKGFCLFNQRDYTRALEVFEEFLKIFPDSPLLQDVKFMRAESLFNLKRYEESLNKFDEFAGEFPVSKYTLQCYLRKGDIYHNTGKYEMARSFYQKVISTQPRTRFVMYATYGLAQTYFKQKKIQRGLGSF